MHEVQCRGKEGHTPRGQPAGGGHRLTCGHMGAGQPELVTHTIQARPQPTGQPEHVSRTSNRVRRRLSITCVRWHATNPR
eukprot:12383076-Alexandrium_andersonii.AAC.1